VKCIKNLKKREYFRDIDVDGRGTLKGIYDIERGSIEWT
jgi:hypothetical protein